MIEEFKIDKDQAKAIELCQQGLLPDEAMRYAKLTQRQRDELGKYLPTFDDWILCKTAKSEP